MDDPALVRRRPGQDRRPPAAGRVAVLRDRGDRLVSAAPHPAPAPQRHRTGSIGAFPSHRQTDSQPTNIRSGRMCGPGIATVSDFSLILRELLPPAFLEFSLCSGAAAI